MLAFLLLANMQLLAQKTNKKVQPSSATAQKETPIVVRSFLGRSDVNGGEIGKDLFDRFLKQGLTAKDSLGTEYKIDGFTFSYAERNLYEDSVGNLVVLTDYLSEFCPGDTVSAAVANNIYYKTKPGDTAYFEGIKIARPDGTRSVARPMRFVITK